MNKQSRRNVWIGVVVGALAVGLILRWTVFSDSGPRVESALADQWDDWQSMDLADGQQAALKWLASQDEAVAQKALAELAYEIGPESKPYIAAVLGDAGKAEPRAAVRSAAVAALGKAGDRKDDAQTVMHALRDDPADEVKAAAVQVLGKWYIWDAMPDLIEAMRSDSKTVRARAYNAIKRITGENKGFKPSAPKAEREAFIRRLEGEWRGYEPAYRDYMKRLGLE